LTSISIAARPAMQDQLDYGLVAYPVLVLAQTHELAQQIEKVMRIEQYA